MSLYLDNLKKIGAWCLMIFLTGGLWIYTSPAHAAEQKTLTIYVHTVVNTSFLPPRSDPGNAIVRAEMLAEATEFCEKGWSSGDISLIPENPRLGDKVYAFVNGKTKVTGKLTQVFVKEKFIFPPESPLDSLEITYSCALASTFKVPAAEFYTFTQHYEYGSDGNFLKSTPFSSQKLKSAKWKITYDYIDREWVLGVPKCGPVCGVLQGSFPWA